MCLAPAHRLTRAPRHPDRPPSCSAPTSTGCGACLEITVCWAVTGGWTSRRCAAVPRCGTAPTTRRAAGWGGACIASPCFAQRPPCAALAVCCANRHLSLAGCLHLQLACRSCERRLGPLNRRPCQPRGAARKHSGPPPSPPPSLRPPSSQMRNAGSVMPADRAAQPLDMVPRSNTGV